MKTDAIDFTTVSPNGKLVTIVSAEHGERAYDPGTNFESNADYAILYPDGTFRRIILDVDGWRELVAAEAAPQLSDAELGRISYLIGKTFESLPAEYQAGFTQAKADEAAKEARLATEILADEAAHIYTLRWHDSTGGDIIGSRNEFATIVQAEAALRARMKDEDFANWEAATIFAVEVTNPDGGFDAVARFSMQDIFPMLSGVIVVAGPFATAGAADAWHYAEQHYTPENAVWQGLDQQFYVIERKTIVEL